MKYVHVKGPHASDKEYVVLSDISAGEILALWKMDRNRYREQYPGYTLPLNRWLSLKGYKFCYTTTLESAVKENAKAERELNKKFAARSEGESIRGL